MSADETERFRATEQTPLLGETDPGPSDQAEEQAPLAEEASFKELIVILGSIWLGVFLAALGMLHLPSSNEFQSNQSYCRFNYRRDTIGAHLVFLQLVLAALLAGNLLPHLECRFPASEWPTD